MEHSAKQKDPFEGSLGIAIIGLAARLPGAKDIDAFWENLCAGEEMIHFFTDDELRQAGVSEAELTHPGYVKSAPILENIDLFDASFFDYTPIEATFMDPQQRLLLECAWQALEDAGYTGERASDAIGVFAGIKMNTYVGDFFAHPEYFGPEDRMQILMGNGDFSLSTRISYKLNLKGPSYMLQTACSTSLAGVHLACQALLLDECRMALVGATAVEVPHRAGYYYQYGGPASPDGHCRPFDARAQGTVFGSGVGMIVLKRLGDALADGDHIYAVIRGTAVNNDGAVKASFTAPSVEGQTQVILEALACANVDADTISYVEAHGTATPLGDPIEMLALTHAFRAGTQRTGFCRIGSVKSNVGHLDATAGLAGLIKTVLALQHQKIPPSLYFEQANPQIDFENSPFVVNTGLTEWTGPLPRRAGVSSFGFGGTNTHVVLEEAPAVEPSCESRPWQLLVLSAKTSTALELATANLAAHLRRRPDLNLADAAYTLQVGRPAFKHRRAIVCRDLADALSLLDNVHDARVSTMAQESGSRPVAFVFPGQGAQYVGMGRELYATESVFREQVDRCAELLHPHLGLDIRSMLYPDSSTAGSAAQRLEQTAMTQPALFVVEYALAQLWQAWGIIPTALIGHSIGEYVAACLAGVFSLEDGLALVAARGQLMQQLPEGAMLSVSLSGQEVRARLDGQLSLAAINGPTRCVVSGPTGAIERLERRLAEDGVVCRRLHTSHAFHSAMMEPILEPFTTQVERITLRPPQIPYLSNISGTWVNSDEATKPAYWANHLRQPVRFADGLGELLSDPDRVLLEVGPGRTLSTLARQYAGTDAQRVILASLPDPKDDQSDVAFLLNTLGALWSTGVKVSWPGFYSGEQRQRVPLPTYPFERRRYWFETTQSYEQRRAESSEAEERHTGKKPDIGDWFYVPSWKRSPLPARNSAEAAARHWLFFLDEWGLGARLAERLEQEGQAVTTVRMGTEFARVSERAFVVNPGRGEDFDALVNELYTLDQRPEAVVHLWSVTPAEPEIPRLERFDRGQRLGFYSLLFLLQALGKRDFNDALQIVVMSNDMQEVTGEETLCPEKATVLGPVRVIPLEYPSVTCCSVDVMLPRHSNDIDQNLIDLLLAEISAVSSDQVIAYRRQHRWVQAFEPVRLADAQAAPSRLREGGVYLITGGTGGIGLAIAQHLAQTVRARLILTGRATVPDSDEWEQWLATHDAEDRMSEKIRGLQALKEMGAEVLVVSVDVTDREQMRAVVAEAHRRWGAVHGVIHAAGVPGGGIIQLKTPEMADDVLAPKVRGALVLHDLFKDIPLDFLALFSSLSAVVGEFGQVDYCAANAFLDALASPHTLGRAMPILTVNWDMWREVGMTMRTSVPAILQEWRETQLQLAMSSAEGIEVFRRALVQTMLPQIMVCTTDIHAKIEQFRSLTRAHILGEVERLSLPGATHLGLKHPRPNLRTPYLAPRNETERMMVAIWQNVLGLERVGIQDSFFELGGDSLIGLKLIAQLKQEFGVEIPPVDLYKGPTVGRLADIINQVAGQAAPDDSARQAGQQRGAQRRERRLQQKHQTGASGGQA